MLWIDRVVLCCHQWWYEGSMVDDHLSLLSNPSSLMVVDVPPLQYP